MGEAEPWVVIPIPGSLMDGEVTPFTPMRGEPLLAYVLRAAGDAVPTVVTDSPAVGEMAERLGAAVAVADEPDFWTLAEAGAAERPGGVVIALGSMSPRVTPEAIEAVVDLFRRSEAQPVVSVTRVEEDHPFKLRYRDADNRCVNLLFDSLVYDKERQGVIHRRSGKSISFRQNLPAVYAITGAVTLFRSQEPGRLRDAVNRGDVAWIERGDLITVDGPISLLRAAMFVSRSTTL